MIYIYKERSIAIPAYNNPTTNPRFQTARHLSAEKKKNVFDQNNDTMHPWQINSEKRLPAV